jgi:putative SOS response-associated peptidase YedK
VASIIRAYGAHDSDLEASPSWNICPSQRVVALRDRGGTPEVFHPLWGFDAPWRPTRSTLVINARVEGVAERPLFRGLLAGHRCVIPLSGWYEWVSVGETLERLGAPKRKVPFYMSAMRGSGHPDGLLTAAGLWQASPTGERIVMLTTEAAPALQYIHNRMPVLLDEVTMDAWLDPGAVPPMAMIATTTVEVDAHRVGYGVSSGRTDGPQLIEPYAGDDQGTLF